MVVALWLWSVVNLLASIALVRASLVREDDGFNKTLGCRHCNARIPSLIRPPEKCPVCERELKARDWKVVEWQYPRFG